MTHRAWFNLRPRAAIIGLLAALLCPACHDPDDLASAETVNAVAAAVPNAEATTARGLRAPAHVARVIVVGDSVSEGIGARQPELSYAGLLVHNDDARYPAYAGQDLTHRYGAQLQTINLAHSGDTSTQVLKEQLPRLSASRLDDDAGLQLPPLLPGAPSAPRGIPAQGHTLVFLTIGGNDLRSVMIGRAPYDGAVLDKTLANLRTIFGYFADPTRFPDGVSLYFASVYDVTDGTDTAHACLPGMVFPGLAHGLERWNAAYQQLAMELHGNLQVTHLDALSLFHGHGFHYDEPGNRYFHRQDASLWLSDRDCIHPNHRGHHELRRAFWRLLE